MHPQHGGGLLIKPLSEGLSLQPVMAYYCFPASSLLASPAAAAAVHTVNPSTGPSSLLLLVLLSVFLSFCRCHFSPNRRRRRLSPCQDGERLLMPGPHMLHMQSHPPMGLCLLQKCCFLSVSEDAKRDKVGRLSGRRHAMRHLQ